MKIISSLVLASFLLLAAQHAIAQGNRTISVGDLLKKVSNKTQRPAASRGPQDDLARLRARYSGDFFATRLPGIYAVRNLDGYATAANLVTADGEVTMNVGTHGMTRGVDGPRLSEAEQKAVIRPLLPHFGTDMMLQFGPLAAPLRMVVLSAVDCAYCAKLEPALAAQNVRYAVIPGALFKENKAVVHRIYCAPDRSKAWLQSLGSGTAPASKNTSCEFDREHFWVLSGLLGGSTPRLVFADGDLMRPSVDAAGIARIQAKIKDLERAGIAFN